MTAYWGSWQRPYRHAIVDAIRSLGPVTRVMEGGCHCGPNLRLLRAEMPHLGLAGFDRSRESIASACAFLPADVGLAVRDWADGVPFTIMDGPVDAILSTYSLAYVPPRILPVVLADALGGVGRHESATLVLAEPMPTETEPAGRVDGAQWDADTPEYRHDYEAVLLGIGVPSSRIERRPLPRWERLNGLLVVTAAGPA